MADSNTLLDTRIEIVTPENIAFAYRLAGPFRRLPAYLIDVTLQIFLIVVAQFALVLLAAVNMLGFGLGWMLLGIFIVAWFYGGLFETFWNGQTPGKWLLDIRVVSADGKPISGFQAVLRNVLRGADAWPVVGFLPMYLVGLVVAAASPWFQRLGDLAAGTMVVVEQRRPHYGIARIEASEAIRLAAELPGSFVVSRSLGRALAAYVQRRHLFSMRRRQEIARHLGAPLRERFDLPLDTNHDLLLCALYHRTFVTDLPGESRRERRREPLPTAGKGDQSAPDDVYSLAE